MLLFVDTARTDDVGIFYQAPQKFDWLACRNRPLTRSGWGLTNRFLKVRSCCIAYVERSGVCTLRCSVCSVYDVSSSLCDVCSGCGVSGSGVPCLRRGPVRLVLNRPFVFPARAALVVSPVPYTQTCACSCPVSATSKYWCVLSYLRGRSICFALLKQIFEMIHLLGGWDGNTNSMPLKTLGV